MVETKRLVKEVTLREREGCFELHRFPNRRLRSSDEGQEGLAAFLEKTSRGWLS